MLLYRLKVLLHTVHENWVVPMRISAGEGIQYCRGTGLKPAAVEATPLVLALALALGGPMDSAIVTGESSSL